jgi:hypothetical protein
LDRRARLRNAVRERIDQLLEALGEDTINPEQTFTAASMSELGVKLRKARYEQMFSALPPISDILNGYLVEFVSLAREIAGHHAARTPRTSAALTPSTTHAGHPRWRGAAVATTIASSVRRSRSIS